MTKKVLISTITGLGNFGNELQNYALQTVINKMGYDAKTLFRENEMSIHIDRGPFRRDQDPQYDSLKSFYRYLRIKAAPRNFVNHLTSKFRAHSSIDDLNGVRRDKFADFRHTFIDDINTVPVSTYSEYQAYRYSADILVIGSDQVWNPMFWHGPYVEFGEYFSGKRISYAASIGLSSIPKKLTSVYSEGLKGLAEISVRESNAVQLVNNAVHRDAQLVLDPTLLLPAESWMEIAVEPGEESYILCYFLSDISDATKKHIDELAMRLNCKIIDIMKPGLYESTGPSEFLGFLKNAEYVLTDSFHACVFSIIFHTMFEVFPRNEGGSVGMAARIDTLFENFEMSSRWNKDVTGETKIDFEKVDGQIEKQRLESMSWLCSALGK